jgi:hypothetical protein
MVVGSGIDSITTCAIGSHHPRPMSLAIISKMRCRCSIWPSGRGRAAEVEEEALRWLAESGQDVCVEAGDGDGVYEVICRMSS